MATNYLSVITAWMKQQTSHLNWDLTIATRPEQLNHLVEQAHYSLEDSVRDDIEGEIALPGFGVIHILTGYRMGPPLLVAMQAAHGSAKVQQRIGLDGGTHLIVDKVDGLLGLAVHDVLDPLPVSQALVLGTDAQGVRADLREGTDTELDLGGGLPLRLAAGRFFKDVLSGVGSARQVYPLVTFGPLPSNPYLQVRRSAVRTYVSKANGNPALVIFSGVFNGPTGNIPDGDSGFPFLLPDDLEQPVSTSVLLTSRFLHRAAYGVGLEHMLEDGAFEASHDTDNNLQRLDAKAGLLRVHPSTYEGDSHEFKCDEFNIAVAGAPLAADTNQRIDSQHGQGCCCCTSALGNVQGQESQADFQSPLSISFERDEVRQHWKSYCTVPLSYRPKSGGAWLMYTATFQFDLQTLFNLNEPTSSEESAGGMLLGQVMWPWQQTAEVTPVSGLPNDMPAELRDETCAFVVYVLKQAVLEGLAKKLTAFIPEQVLDGMTLAGWHHLAPFRHEVPDGIAMFADHGGVAGFRVVDPPLTLAPAQRHTFTIDPPLEEVTWSLRALPGSVGDLGRLDPATGDYRAPPAHAMGDDPMRAMVVATHSQTGSQSTTLVTVVPSAMTVNPLVRVCYVDDSFPLTAGTLDGGLEWSVADADGDGRGSVVPDAGGKRCTYSTGAKVEGNQTYVLDEVRVRNTLTDETRSIYVLVRQRGPEMTVTLTQQQDGKWHLQGRAYGTDLKGVEWTLPIAGTGTIDGENNDCYTPPSEDSEARFTLIIGKWVLPDTEFIFEGHLLLQLSLSQHFSAMRRAANPAGLRVAPAPSIGG
ncbi:hypothetical protein [Pseudomonas alloputida]|uniref:hypothetical protein n=1 Tax=Pseudomonas TaxID=286 RepID=UPI003EEE8A98